ncbi:MAG TPA: hypothetical protein VGG85_13900 [Terracidiphilus sp.]
MRKTAVFACLTLAFLLAVPNGFAKPPVPAKNGGAIVIVFKDGHRQTYNLADIERVEFPTSAMTASETAPLNSTAPPRGHFVGKWEVGDGNGNNFYITLKENGEAWRSLREVGGRWEFVNGEARITWDDGAMDAIRKVGPNYQKFAYQRGKSFTDTADNVTNAHLTNPRPI